ncbi:hypothetical protein A4A49_66115, partial [Nicotiana attenuata]
MLLILSNLFLFSDGRNLATKENLNLVYQVKETFGAEVEKKLRMLALMSSGFRFMEGTVDAYQPSTPGHSPGIGHSRH